MASAAADPWRRCCRTRRRAHLSLAQLERPGTAAWLRASFFPDAHDRFCAAVHESAGGSAWLVGELCRELAAAGVSPDAAGSAQVRAAAPEPLAASVMRRARAIDPGAAALLEAAAVLGAGAELRYAAVLTGLGRRAWRLSGAWRRSGCSRRTSASLSRSR